MRVQLERDPQRWDMRLEGTRHDIFHTAGFQRFAASMDEGDPYLIVVGDTDRGLAWPYVLRRVDVACGLDDSGARDVGSFHGYTGPVTWGLKPDDPFISQALDEVRRAWREQGAISAFTRFHPLLDNAAAMQGRLTDGRATPEPLGETISIDCTIGEDEAVDGYARVLRQEISRARRAGLQTEPDPEWTHLETFVRLYQDSMARKRAPAAYAVSSSDVQRMRDEMGEHLHLFVTRTERDVAAAGIFSEHQGYVGALMVGTDEAYRRWSPIKVMLDDVRRWAQGRGDTALHIGSGQGGRRDSLFDFKRRFSSRRHPLRIGTWILDRERYRELVALRSQRLSEVGLRASDTGWFPAYRSPVMPSRPVGADKTRTELARIPIAPERVRITVRPGLGATPVDRERVLEGVLR